MEAKFKDLGVFEYQKAWDLQEDLFRTSVKMRGAGEENIPNYLFFVEHPNVYTLGKSGHEQNLLINTIQLQAKDATFIPTNRGGDITYHGPGQIVGYPIFDILTINMGVKEYIDNLEEAIIKTIAEYGIVGTRLEGSTGVWLDVDKPGLTRKICAIGVKCSRHITMHGFALNVNTNLDYFNYINPCGFVDKGVTSIEKELGKTVDFEECKLICKSKLAEVFNIEYEI
jgi:lipoyl(octanoyl) transferase